MRRFVLSTSRATSGEVCRHRAGNPIRVAPSSPFSASRLSLLRSTYAPRSLAKPDLLASEYLLAAEGPYRVYYAPLGSMPASTAKIVLVGLTPGLSQAAEAARLFLECPDQLRDDGPRYDALLRERVAFKGSMRANLCSMLDDLGLPGFLQLPNSESLFRANSQMAATTSALVYPVFTGPALRNFSGAGSNLAAVPLFRRMLEELLAPRLAAAPEALIVPFGKAAASGVRFLAEIGDVSSARILDRFPHPSGANGHRRRQFALERASLASDISAWFSRTFEFAGMP